MFADLVEELLVTDDAALVERLRSNELEARRLAAEQAAITREVDRRLLYCDDGHRSVTAFLRANLNWSNAQAASGTRNAKLLDTVPGVGDALLDGHIGTAQANELGRLRANPRVGDQLVDASTSVDTLLGAAEQMKYEDFRIVTQRWEAFADTDGAAEQAAKHLEHRDATVLDAGGELFMRATGGSALDVAELVAVFDAFVDNEFRIDCDQRDAEHGAHAPRSLLPRTDKQRRRDALQRIVRAADAAVVAGLEVGPIPTMVNIVSTRFDTEHALALAGLISTPTDLIEPPLTKRRRETSTGSPISNDQLVRSVVHGRVRSVLADNTGMPISYGRTRRLFTGPIRDMAKLLGHRCSHPGCDVPAKRCQVDHVREFLDGGDTSLQNAGLECSSHNRHKHRARLNRQRKRTDEVVTTRADGSQMRPVGQRTRADVIRSKLTPKKPVSPEVAAALAASWRPDANGRLHVVRLELIDGEAILAS